METKTKRKKIEHDLICEYCKQHFKSTNRKKKCCSWSCSNKLGHKTFIDKTGLQNVSQRQSFKDKVKETCLEKYGVENVSQLKETQEKIQKTSLRKRGIKHHLSDQNVINKRVDTLRETYGVDNIAKVQEVQEKTIQTNIEKYGVDYPLKLEETKQKGYITKKIKGSLNSSKKEDKIYDLLSLHFSNIERQYKSDEYPWSCDFYIPSEDLYIEFNGNWTHGKEPFDERDIRHKERIRICYERSNDLNFNNKKKSYYLKVIQTWAVRDVKKRNHAKENNLNWVEFFNEQDVYRWLENYEKC